jgi:hypothetical protein
MERASRASRVRDDTEEPMADTHGDTGRGEGRRHRTEAIVLIANLVLVGFVLVYLAVTRVGRERVTPLVESDPQTAARIALLEQSLAKDPGNLLGALELSRLYEEAGEFPWSYDALKSVEQKGGDDPTFRIQLGLAYLELGKNKDSVRIFESTLERCGIVKCPSNAQVKLELFGRVAKIFLAKKIDARRQRVEAEKALREVLRPVEVDPEKMRAKAPVAPGAPEPAPAPAKTPAKLKKNST